MNNLESYYHHKSRHYGMSGLRLRHILNLIGPTKNLKILDVGCATGYLGHKLKKMHNYVVGIDISKSAIKQARKVLDEAFCLNLETQTLPGTQKFDLIIVSEVIEHLFLPQTAINKLVTRLKLTGQMIITTPNISFWINRCTFLLGKFTYSNQGMFDESHIHFFNYYSLKKMLKENNLSILKENHITFPYTIKRLLKYFPNLFAYQLVISAKKWPKKRG